MTSLRCAAAAAPFSLGSIDSTSRIRSCVNAGTPRVFRELSHRQDTGALSSAARAPSSTAFPVFLSNPSITPPAPSVWPFHTSSYHRCLPQTVLPEDRRASVSVLRELPGSAISGCTGCFFRPPTSRLASLPHSTHSVALRCHPRVFQPLVETRALHLTLPL